MEEFFNFLRLNKITANGYHALYKLTEIIGQRDIMNFVIELHKLEIDGYITKTTEGTPTITIKGVNVLTQGKKFFTNKKKLKFNLEDFENNIIAYNNLFPKGRKENSSEGFRSNPKELLDRFIWFFNKYPEYTWEAVLTATENYVKVFNGNYTYLQLSRYFIKKQDKQGDISSRLAEICYTISQGNDIDVENEGYHYFK